LQVILSIGSTNSMASMRPVLLFGGKTSICEWRRDVLCAGLAVGVIFFEAVINFG
jgi:hypothetical protein